MVTKGNGHKIRKFRAIHSAYLIGALISGFYASSNIWEAHKFDKNVIKHIEIAANAPSAGSSENITLSMESSLGEARKNSRISKSLNPAWIWKTPLSDVRMLEKLLDIAILRSHQIEQFKESLRTGEIKEEYPTWVKDAFNSINPNNFRNSNYDLSSNLRTSLEQLTQSEYGQRIAYEYEALNNSIAGGTRTTGKNVKERHKSLLDTLDKAGGIRSIVRLQADDFKRTHAHVFIGYLMSNMGNLDEGLKNFYEAKRRMNHYKNSKNLAFLRKTPELSQAIIKGLLDSSIRELEILNSDPTKYSAGWWKRLTYYNQSIGGQANPSIQDLAEGINSKYLERAFYSGILSLGLFYVAGRYAKKAMLSKKYEVKTTNPSRYGRRKII